MEAASVSAGAKENLAGAGVVSASSVFFSAPANENPPPPAGKENAGLSLDVVVVVPNGDAVEAPPKEKPSAGGGFAGAVSETVSVTACVGGAKENVTAAGAAVVAAPPMLNAGANAGTAPEEEKDVAGGAFPNALAVDVDDEDEDDAVAVPNEKPPAFASGRLCPPPNPLGAWCDTVLRCPDCKKRNVSLVWAISRRNVVIGQYLPEDETCGRSSRAVSWAET